MTGKNSDKKSPLITVFAIIVLVSLVIAAQFPSNQGGNNASDNALNTYQNNSVESSEILGTSPSVASDNWNMLSSLQGSPTSNEAADTDETIGDIEANIESVEPDENKQVSEEKNVITVKSSTEDEVQVAKTDGNVSRGTQNTNTVASTSSNDIAHFWQNRKTWLQPVKGRQTADPTGSARYFGAPRSNGRYHAAIDFIAPGGTIVYAMTDGKVIRTSLFFENTSAVEVQNTDGTVARYCEISPSVSVGTIVHRGDVIGKIITNYAGTSMLHLEMYMGTSSGSLSQGNSSNYKYVAVRNYQRRSDLIDPTGAIYLPVK